MAYNTRGSRPIVVQGMSFRWRADDAGAGFVAWHVLDAGRLTVRYPDPLFPPTPGFVARAIAHALDTGWRTDVHRHVDLAIEEFRRVDGYSNQSRAIALPGLENLLEHEADTLGAPDPERAFPRAEGVLQVVFAPTFLPACILTLWSESGDGFAHLVGVVDGERTEWLVESEGDWIRDAIVSVRTASTPSEGGRMVRDGMPLRATLRDAAGTWSHTDNVPAEGTPVRVAALDAWRIGMESFGSTRAAARVLEGLHPYLQPGTLPWSEDPHDRVLRLYGAWSWPLGRQLVERLRNAFEPWIVDARDVTLFAAQTVQELRAVHRSRAVPLFWIADEEQLLPWQTSHDRPAAERARMLASREILSRVVQTFDARWRGIARDTLLSRRSDRISRAADEMERWLGPGWTPATAVAPLGWRHESGAWEWGPDTGTPGLLVDGRHAWLRTPDGRVLACPVGRPPREAPEP